MGERPDAVIAGVGRGFRVKFFLKWGGKDVLPGIEKVAKSGRFPVMAIHLAAFDYKHAYPIKNLLGSILRDAKRIEQLARKYPKVKLSLSPFCEHNHSAVAMGPVFSKLKEAAPSCSQFNAIWRGEVVSGITTEIHLENSKPRAKPRGPYGVDLDGFGGDGSGNSSDANLDSLLARYPDALWFDIWCFQCNGKFGWKDGRAVKDRDDYASKEVLAGHCAVLQPREGGLTWDKSMLLKPFADDHDQADSAPGNKDNQFMCILPWSGKAQVLDRNGKVIITLTRVNPDYNSGGLKGPRYYAMQKGLEFAYQIAAQAVKNTGSNLICVKVGSKKTPLTDGRKRSGRF